MEHEGDGNTNYKWYTRTIPKRLVKGLKNLKISGQVDTIQTTVLLISARILRRVQET